MGGVKCNANCSSERIDYFMHRGVAPRGPYVSDSRFDNNTQLAGLSSPQLMLSALRHHQGLWSRSVLVFSSLLWDLRRHHEFFRSQSEDDWADAFAADYASAVQLLQASLRPCDALVLIADYGCVGS